MTFEKLRIGLLSYESLHTVKSGGVAVHATELGAALQRMGHEVHIFTQRSPGQPSHMSVDIVHYHLVDMPGVDRGDFCHRIWEFNQALVDAFHKTQSFDGNFNIVHGHDWLVSDALIQIKDKNPHLKSLFSIHSTEFGRNGNKVYEHGEHGRIHELERHGTYCAHRVIAVSGYLKGEVQKLYNTPDWKVDVIYNGLSLQEFNEVPLGDPKPIKAKYGIAPLDPVVLFVGRMSLQKGPDLLMDAVPSLLQAHTSTKVVFVGDGHLYQPLVNKARALGVEYAVRLLGNISRYETIQLFKACDILCVPSRNEPFGIVILEGWAAGKPVVCTHNGGPSEFVDDGTGIKTYDCSNSISWGLRQLLTNYEYGHWLGENGHKKLLAHFSWDNIAHQTVQAYYRALHS